MKEQRNMELVHMKPKEIQLLNHILGGNISRTPQGAWDLSGLEHIFRNPMVQEAFDNDMDYDKVQKLARGGHVNYVEEMREDGRHGDSEAAWMPKEVTHIFDRHINGPSINPATGHKEYFLPAIGMALARLAPMAISMFSRAAPAIATAGRTAASGARTFGSGALSAGRSIAANPYVRSIGSGARTAGGAIGRGLEMASNAANIALPLQAAYDRWGPQSAAPAPTPAPYDPYDVGRTGTDEPDYTSHMVNGEYISPSMRFSGREYVHPSGRTPAGTTMAAPSTPSTPSAPSSTPPYGEGYNPYAGGYQSPGSDYSGYYGNSSYPNYDEYDYNRTSPTSSSTSPRSSSFSAPQYGGYAEAINRYGPSAYGPTAPDYSSYMRSSSPRRSYSSPQSYNPNPYGMGSRNPYGNPYLMY